MKICILLGCIFSAQPPATPAHAAAILAASGSQANVANWPALPAGNGPHVSFTGATGPTLGPWDWPKAPEPRRLDGSSLLVPPAVYGQIPYPWLQVPFWSLAPGCQNCNSHDSGPKPRGH